MPSQARYPGTRSPVLPSLGGALPLRHAFFLDEMVRPVLGLREHAAKIFANNAQAQQLDASEQQDHHHGGRVARHVDAAYERPDNIA